MHAPRGFSLVGLLIVVVCGMVLFVILMNSLNLAVTGQGSARENTVRSLEDKLTLTSLVQTMIASAGDHGGRFVTPSRITGTDDVALDTTANFYSAMVALQYVTPEMLVSGNEYNGYVEPMEDYDFLSYQPASGRYWDPNFKADLAFLSHVSFAHEPLFGERHDRHWGPTMNSVFPLVGNRGPKDGVDDPNSETYGRNGQWGGHMAYGDGHVAFIDTFTPGLSFDLDGATYSDNVFAMEDGPHGADAIISFTQAMSSSGPTFQWD